MSSIFLADGRAAARVSAAAVRASQWNGGSGCLFLAAFVDNCEVVTVEGLADRGVLHPIQQAFISKCGFQCGYCTPGFILMTEQLLKQNLHPSDDQIRHYLSGNLCRCAAYPDIIEAVKEAGTQMAAGQKNL